MDSLRRAVVILARVTGWGLAEIMDMDLSHPVDGFWAWVESAQAVENEIAEAMAP